MEDQEFLAKLKDAVKEIDFPKIQAARKRINDMMKEKVEDTYRNLSPDVRAAAAELSHHLGNSFVPLKTATDLLAESKGNAAESLREFLPSVIKDLEALPQRVRGPLHVFKEQMDSIMEEDRKKTGRSFSEEDYKDIAFIDDMVNKSYKVVEQLRELQKTNIVQL
jgi:hypothetical protein